MATVNPGSESPGSRLAGERMDASIDAVVAGRPAYPSGTVFIGADMDGFGEVLARTIRARQPIVVVYPDGEERFLLPTPPPDE
jgi:hypothetical protein